MTMAHVHTRSLGPPDPLAVPPRSDMAPNDNLPVGSTGPNVPVAGDPSAQGGASGGAGAQQVMYLADAPPLQAAAWAGWPSEWRTPTTASLGGLGPSGADLDIVWACVDLNARTTGDMPLYVVNRRGTLLDPPTWLTGSPQPEVYGTFGEFWRQVWWARQVVGEAFIVCTSRFLDTDQPRTFIMVNPMFVSVDLVDGLRTYTVAGMPIPRRDMLHIRYMSWPGDAHGHGPLEVAGYRTTAARALMRYGADLAQNGGIPWAVLQHKYRLTQDQADNLKRRWIEAARDRMGAPAIIDNDMTLQALNVTPRDMALSEQQRYAEARLAVLLGVPPELVGLASDTGSLTYQNVSMIFDRHWRSGLKPGGRDICAELSAWALPRGTDLRLNAEAYVQPSATERASYYKTMIELGVMSAAEVRAVERIPITDTAQVQTATEVETADEPTA